MRGALSGKHCLPNGEWTKLAPFCNRTCSLPPKVLYAAMKDIFIPVSYRPVGFVVEYECNPGYERNHSVSAEVTCLRNYTWSTLQVFCYKRSCPDPGQIENGHISIPTDILFASDIYFSCNPGYKLVGENSTFCYYEGKDMVWADPFPVCQEIPTTTQKPTTTDAQSSKAPSSHQKPTTVNVPGTESPSTPPKPTTVNVPVTESPSTPPKPTTVNVPATESPSTPPKPTTVNVPATKPPPALQKPTTVNVPGTESPSTPQKHTIINVPATKSPSTPQKHTIIKVPATKSPSTPQKPTTVNISATEAPSAPQKPTTVNVPATKSPSAPQKPTTVNVPAIKSPSPSPKPTTVNVPATEATPTLQNLTTGNSSTTKALLIPQTPNFTVLAMDAPPISQKPLTANDSATIAKLSPVSNVLLTETQLTVQTLIMTNSSATRATPKPQSFTTAKASYTQSLPVTKKFTMVHAPMTKGLHTTQRLTSAHIAATQNEAIFTTPSISKGSGLLTAGITIIGTGKSDSLTVKRNRHRCSSSYYIQENNKEFNVMFHNLTETGDASEVWPSGKFERICKLTANKDGGALTTRGQTVDRLTSRYDMH
ncbi:Complement decay-accelerating factor transmembrane isoform [Myotis brandtii]|uniref:Complement decay-accelerating factor transmembrane isoform n=1 Tax=Myotis brandtii TaxID=109478 RepID=S7NPA2_MYOBR|nr:Complement decay-accelerating factor transmembrane isoform [Myotis brandtii]